MPKLLLLLLTPTLLWSQTKPKPPYNSMYLCMNCEGSVGASSMDQFYGAYEQMGVNKKEMLAVGSAYAMTIPKNPYDDKGKERSRFFKEKNIPYSSKDSMGDYQIMQSHMGDKGANKAQIKENLLKYFKQLDKSKPVVLHIAGHGWNGGMAGDGTLPPEKAGIALYSPNAFDSPSKVILTHEELAALMTQAGLTGPSAPPVRIVAEHCYGGGVHWLSEKFSNVCSSSFSSYKQMHMVAEHLPEKFWGNYNEMKELGMKPSLSDTFMSIYGDRGRNDGASLSSTFYVRETLAKHGKSSGMKDGFKDWFNYLHNNDITSEDKCEFKALPASENQDTLKYLMKDMGQVFDSSDLAKGLWKQHGINANPYMEALQDLAKNEAKYKQLMKIYQAKLTEMQKKWNALDNKQKLNKQREWTSSMEDFGTWFVGDLESEIKAEDKRLSSKKDNLIKEFNDYKKNHLKDIAQYLANKDKVNLFKEASQFHQLHKQGKIGKKEMDNYKRMLKCEALPL